MENLYGFFDSSSSSAGFTSSSDHYSSSSMALPEQLVEYYRNFETLSAVIPPAAATGYNYSGKSNSSAAVSCCVNTAAVNQGGGEDVSCNVNDKIASHPLYPKLLQAYIDCQKVGAPPQIVNMLEEIQRESCQLGKRAGGSTNCMGIDPELDAFMETYCEVLVKYKSDLTKPFDEAITFLNSMETQLSTLANTNGAAAGHSSDEEDLSLGEIDVLDVEHQRTNVDHELKDKLLRKYSGYITSLKNEFCKKRKKGKLPRDAKQILEDWWNLHCKWPYPTEVDKLTLAQTTGLDQKQINNWFINQRKRHWKPSENMQLAVMDSLYGPCSFYKD